jgi:hypothetical protein
LNLDIIYKDVLYLKIKYNFEGQAWWYVSVIPAMWETEVGRSWSEAGLRKKFETLPEK